MMRLLVDIDGTLRHVWPAVNDRILEATGVELPAEWPTYDVVRNTVGDEAADAAFSEVCGHYSDDDLWYPGAWDAMRALAEGGVEPVFCTLNPSRQARTIERALSLMYASPARVERVLDAANKIRVARRLEAVGIVDDKPSTLWAFRRAGLFTATVNHAYNSYPLVNYRFDDWREADLLGAVRDYARHNNRKGVA